MDSKRGRTSVATTKITLKNLTEAPVVRLTWIDAQADAGWEEPKVDLATCITVGFLVAETDDGICVAGTVSDHLCNNVISIPKSWIIDQQIEVKDEAPVSKSKGKKPAKVGRSATPKKISSAKAGRLSVDINGRRGRGCKTKSPC
jgi:hypothetical protein